MKWDKKAQGVWVRGNASLFKPRVRNAFRDYLESGKVTISEDSTSQVEVFIARTKGTRIISNDEIYEMAVNASKMRKKYTCIVNMPNNELKIISIKEWLQRAHDNYSAAFGAWQQNQIEVIDLRIAIAQLLPEVAELLRKNKTDKEILAAMKGSKLNNKILDNIKTKPLRMLRKTDFSKEIAELESGKQIVIDDSPEKLIASCYVNRKDAVGGSS